MRRTMVGVSLILLLAGAGRASAGGLDVRMGAFFPRARDCGIPSSVPSEYTLFMDVCELYVPESRSLDDLDWKSEFIGAYGGIEYNLVLDRYLELGFHTDWYHRSVDTSYREFTRPDDTEIRQTLHLDIVPMGVTIRLIPTDKRRTVAPYVGAGVDAFYWRYEEYGDFIDFYDPDLAISGDFFHADGWDVGAHVVAGVRVYLNRDFAIVGEGRYQWGKADMGGDFSPNEPGLFNRLDLSGVSATVGLHVRF